MHRTEIIGAKGRLLEQIRAQGIDPVQLSIIRIVQLAAVAEPFPKRRCCGQGVSETSFYGRIVEFDGLKAGQVR
jgi:hypothetical protein